MRIFRHLSSLEWRVRRAFPADALAAIERAIADGEKQHAGQVCFAVEGALSGPALIKGQSARERAVEVFSHLGVWDTEHNNGVLIYLLLADRDVEIVVDRGIHARVASSEWEAICRRIEAAFGAGRYVDGALEGIRAVSELLGRHFPATGNPLNELPNRPVLY